MSPGNGKNAVFENVEEGDDTDAPQLSISIHAFDVIVADECHRGYSGDELVGDVDRVGEIADRSVEASDPAAPL